MADEMDGEFAEWGLQDEAGRKRRAPPRRPMRSVRKPQARRMVPNIRRPSAKPLPRKQPTPRTRINIRFPTLPLWGTPPTSAGQPPAASPSQAVGIPPAEAMPRQAASSLPAPFGGGNTGGTENVSGHFPALPLSPPTAGATQQGGFDQLRCVQDCLNQTANHQSVPSTPEQGTDDKSPPPEPVMGDAAPEESEWEHPQACSCKACQHNPHPVGCSCIGCQLNNLKAHVTQINQEINSSKKAMGLHERWKISNADYIKWVQKSLNKTLKTKLPITGVLDSRTMKMLRLFQKKAGIKKAKPLESQTEKWLIKNTRTKPSNLSARVLEQETAEAIGVGFEILRSAIQTVQQGDVQVTWPSSQIGIVATNKPKNIKAYESSRIIASWREISPVGIEQVNIRLRCHVQFNGLEVQATFSFDAEGRRSRLMRDTTIVINNPLSLKTFPVTSEYWIGKGIKEYPVIRIPIEFRVDRPWPLENRNETFTLVLSGMYGFGEDQRGIYIENRRVVWN